MIRLLIHMLRILLVPCLLACSTPAPQRPIENTAGAHGTLPCDRPLAKDTGGIHGVIVGKVSKQPVAGVTVHAILHAHIMPPHPSTVTDSTGCYFIGSLPEFPGVELGYYTDTSGGREHVDIVAGKLLTRNLILDDSPSFPD